MTKKQDLQPDPEKRPMAPEHQKQWDAYAEKALNAPTPPKLVKDGDSYQINMPPEGLAMQLLQLHNLTGTVFPEAGTQLLNQILDITEDGRRNNALALVTEIQPKDPIEGMLAAQMLAVHNMAMKKAKTAINGKDLNMKQAEHANRSAMAAMRLFTAQVEALAKWRSKGKQKIVVEYLDNRGGQAILGDVTKGGGNGA